MESGANIPAPAMADIRSGRKRAAQLTSTWNGIGPEKQKLVYDPQQPIWSLLLWHETILPLTLKRNEIYVFTALHTALAILKHLNITDPWGNSPINAIVAPVSLLAFFVVFYNSQCYSRFTSLYSHCCAMGSTLHEATQQMNTHAPDNRKLKWDATRYLAASVCLTYIGSRDSASRAEEIDEWKWLSTPFTVTPQNSTAAPLLHKSVYSSLYGAVRAKAEAPAEARKKKKEGLAVAVACPPLLSKAEVGILKVADSVTFTLHTWALGCMARAYDESGIPASSPTYTCAADTVHRLRGAISFINNTLALQVPFPYFHVLNLLSTITFILIAFGFLTIHVYFSPVFYFVTVLIFCALRDISAALADPFGSDEVDLPVLHMLYTVRQQASIFAGVASAATEPPAPPPPPTTTPPAPMSDYEALHAAVAQACAKSSHRRCFQWPEQFAARLEHAAEAGSARERAV